MNDQHFSYARPRKPRAFEVKNAIGEWRAGQLTVRPGENRARSDQGRQKNQHPEPAEMPSRLLDADPFPRRLFRDVQIVFPHRNYCRPRTGTPAKIRHIWHHDIRTLRCRARRYYHILGGHFSLTCESGHKLATGSSSSFSARLCFGSRPARAPLIAWQ